jgi:hypothetical protein
MEIRYLKDVNDNLRDQISNLTWLNSAAEQAHAKDLEKLKFTRQTLKDERFAAQIRYDTLVE